jgi:tRNA-specific adenosine deaminase 2
MCAGALLLLGIHKVYCCAGNDRFGGCGSVLKVNQQMNQRFDCFMFEKKEATEILKVFYAEDNPMAPQEKKKKLEK